MIHNILEERMNFIFIKGLMEPLQVMGKISKPKIIYDAIRET